MHVWALKRSGTGATDDCEPLCGCWEPNTGLQVQPSLQHQEIYFKVYIFELQLQWEIEVGGSEIQDRPRLLETLSKNNNAHTH